MCVGLGRHQRAANRLVPDVLTASQTTHQMPASALSNKQVCVFPSVAQGGSWPIPEETWEDREEEEDCGSVCVYVCACQSSLGPISSVFFV